MDLKTWRKQTDITQKQLADMIGLSNVTICRYEAGERIPTDKAVVLKILEITKGLVTPNDFYNLQHSHPGN